MRIIAAATLLMTLVGCGGGGDSAKAPSATPAEFEISVTVSGLAAGSSLTLSDNGSDSLPVTQNGTSTFANLLLNGATYSVSVTSQPAAATCSVASGTGTIVAANASVAVSCLGPIQVGGTVTGLGSGLQILLTDNGTDSLTVSDNGSFTFNSGIKPGSPYSAAIGTLPAGEQCSLQNATGTVSDTPVTTIEVVCTEPTLTLYAGALGGSGSADGPAASARFNNPVGVALDAKGNLYIADTYNATLRKLDAAGNVTTIAGEVRVNGTADGKGAAALFNDPRYLTVDAAGTVYLTDAGANTVRSVTADGTVTTLAGNPYHSGTTDGLGAAALFQNPAGIELTPSGSLYVADAGRIRNVTMGGEVTTPYSESSFEIADFAMESQTVLVATNPNFSAGGGTVERIDLAAGTHTTIASGLEGPTGIVEAPTGSSAAGTIYVDDATGDTVYAVGAGNSLTVLAGASGASNYGSADGVGTAARFWIPNGSAIDSGGNIYIADSGNNEIRKVTPAGMVTTIAGAAIQEGEIDDIGAAARFSYPQALEVDASGNLYVAEPAAIRKIGVGGIVTHAVAPGPLPGLLSFGNGFGVDSAGNVYGAIGSTIVKIATDGTVTKIAGSPSTNAFLDGANAFFNYPSGVARDSGGNLYVADTRNYLIRKITPDGTVSTLAGEPGVPGQSDGAGATAHFSHPVAVLVDVTGTLFVLDGNALRSLSPTGVVTTFAGSQTAGSADGTGNAAQFNGPTGLAFGPQGSFYVTDTTNHEVRKVTAAGVVTTIAGSPARGGVSPGVLPASLNTPSGIAFVGTTLFISDSAENSVLEIAGAP